jgi:hypothetical protein
MSGKNRKNISLSIGQKQELQEYAKNKRLKKSELVVWIEKKFNKTIDRSTVSKILKSNLNLKEVSIDTTRVKQVKHPQLDGKLKEWFLRYENLTIISDSMIREKAKSFAQQLKISEESLTFSDGWLEKFKHRHNIKRRTIHGESGSANQTAIETELPELVETIEKFDPNDVFNFDETALFFRLEPDKTLASKRIEGRKKNKERITVGFCVNSTGTEKMVPIVIGKYAKPRCFKNINLSNIGVYYRYNSKAWMTGIIFQEWLKTFDKLIRLKSQNRKVLLLLDNAGSHNINGIELKNVEIKFLPPNSTSKLQPLDAGIIASFKAKYRQKYIRYLLNEIEANRFNQQKLDLIGSIRFLVKSWDEVSEQTIKNCWIHSKLIKHQEFESTVIESNITETSNSIESLNLENPMTFEEFVNIPEEIIIEDILNEESDQIEEDNELIDDSVVEEKVKDSEAMTACNTLMRYLEQQSDDYSSHLKILRQINSNINQNQTNSKIQSSILDYFNKK